MAIISGNGKCGNFVVSVTPIPLILVDSSDSIIWLGGMVSLTDEARILASNISLQDFLKELKISYSLEEPSLSDIPIGLQE